MGGDTAVATTPATAETERGEECLPVGTDPDNPAKQPDGGGGSTDEGALGSGGGDSGSGAGGKNSSSGDGDGDAAENQSLLITVAKQRKSGESGGGGGGGGGNNKAPPTKKASFGDNFSMAIKKASATPRELLGSKWQSEPSSSQTEAKFCPKRAAEKAGEATKNAAEETANRLKSVFQRSETAESSASDAPARKRDKAVEAVRVQLRLAEETANKAKAAAARTISGKSKITSKQLASNVADAGDEQIDRRSESSASDAPARKRDKAREAVRETASKAKAAAAWTISGKSKITSKQLASIVADAGGEEIDKRSNESDGEAEAKKKTAPVSQVAAKARDILVVPVKAGAAVVGTMVGGMNEIRQNLSGADERSADVEKLEEPLIPAENRESSIKIVASNQRDVAVSASEDSDEASSQRDAVVSAAKDNGGTKNLASSDWGANKACYFAHFSQDTIVLGRVLEFAVRDSTILTVASCVVVWLTYRGFPTIAEEGTVPMGTALSWTAMGFLVGFHWSLLISYVPPLPAAIQDVGAPSEERRISEGDDASLRRSAGLLTAPPVGPAADRAPSAASGRSAADSVEDDRHKLFGQAVSCISSQRISIRWMADRATESAGMTVADTKAQLLPETFWTCLHEGGDRKKQPWELGLFRFSENDYLEKRMLRYSDFRIKEKGSEWSGGSMKAVPEGAPGGESGGERKAEEVPSAEQLKESVQQLGTVAIRNKSNVSSLAEDFEVDPLFRLRGMDVFRTDCPEDRIFRQTLLTQMGLRKVPTLLVNIMTPWAHILVYFQMPDWVKQFKDIKEEEDDLEDTKALKRFLTRDDQYRNSRFKIIPSLVNGPLAIRLMAPPKKEVTCTISRNVLPVSWHFSDERSGRDGSTRAALIEVDCDLITSQSVRKITSIVRPHIKKVTMDCVLIIEKPFGSKLEEPSACLGFWRIDKIDLEGCAVLPAKTEKELVREASEVMGCVQPEALAPEIAVAAG